MKKIWLHYAECVRISDKDICSGRRSLSARILSVFIPGVFASCLMAAAPAPTAVHGLALHDAPKYAVDFKHFDYVNPDAPKGGNLTMVAVAGSFDSLNPFILKGLPAEGIGMVYETLLTKSADEPLTGYGLIAKDMIVPQDRSWIIFKLRPEAKFQDGKPITADDVVWSFNTLLKQGQPFYRSYYAQVKEVKAIDAHSVKFTFKQANNRELPLIVGDIPVLPKHYWMSGKHDFSKTTLEPPMGSGPYKVKSVDAGRRIVYERDKNWWGKGLAVNKGRYNFDTLTFDYYRDPTVAFQAFLAGNVDFRQENIAKMWAQGYNHPAVTKGLIKKEEIKHGLPTGMQGFAYNTRRDLFKDVRVREALAYAFDFEWSNKQLAFDSYKRCNSYFSNSDLGATMPISAAEKKLLEPYKDQLPPRVFTDVYQAPKTAGNGDMRQNLRHATELLKQAGWVMQDGVLKNAKGEEFKFEILNYTPMFDRWLLPMIGNLKKLGITANLRMIDTAQYQNRVNDFDFDMVIESLPQSLTPGNEQAGYWSSVAADTKGSQNLIGIKNPVVDALLGKITQAQTREELVTATRALDRVLQWNFYTIPQWYLDKFRIAYWTKLGRPAVNPPYGLPVADTWWVKAEK
jgi:microcin C transport system substrate-binding protein